jgi:hypothetical protein
VRWGNWPFIVFCLSALVFNTSAFMIRRKRL